MMDRGRTSSKSKTATSSESPAHFVLKHLRKGNHSEEVTYRPNPRLARDDEPPLLGVLVVLSTRILFEFESSQNKKTYV